MDKLARDHNVASSLLATIESNRTAAYLELLKKQREAKLEQVMTPEERKKQPFFEEDLPFDEVLGIAEKLMMK